MNDPLFFEAFVAKFLAGSNKFLLSTHVDSVVTGIGSMWVKGKEGNATAHVSSLRGFDVTTLLVLMTPTFKIVYKKEFKKNPLTPAMYCLRDAMIPYYEAEVAKRKARAGITGKAKA